MPYPFFKKYVEKLKVEEQQPKVSVPLKTEKPEFAELRTRKAIYRGPMLSYINKLKLIEDLAVYTEGDTIHITEGEEPLGDAPTSAAPIVENESKKLETAITDKTAKAKTASNKKPATKKAVKK